MLLPDLIGFHCFPYLLQEPDSHKPSADFSIGKLVLDAATLGGWVAA